MVGDSLGYNDGKVLGYDQGIKLGLSGGKFFGTILLNVYGIILGIYAGTDLVSLDGSFYNIHRFLWWSKPRWPCLIFVPDPYLIYFGDPCSNCGYFAPFFKELCFAVLSPRFSCRFFLKSPTSLSYTT